MNGTCVTEWKKPPNTSEMNWVELVCRLLYAGAFPKDDGYIEFSVLTRPEIKDHFSKSYLQLTFEQFTARCKQSWKLLRKKLE